MKKVLGIFLCLVLVLSMTLFSGCSKSTVEIKDSSSGKKISVYTSFYAMYDLTKKIGGDKITVTNLVPAGTEPHEWEPKPSDMANIVVILIFVLLYKNVLSKIIFKRAMKASK